jgi:hypothetical protein
VELNADICTQMFWQSVEQHFQLYILTHLFHMLLTNFGSTLHICATLIGELGSGHVMLFCCIIDTNYQLISGK